MPPPTLPAPTVPTPTLQPPTFLGPVETLPQAPVAPLTVSEKRVQVGPRSNAPIYIKSFPGTLPNQSVTVFSNGIRAVIEGIEAPHMGNLGRIVIETDRLVLWGPNLKTLSSAGSETAGGAEVPIEVYMEGNIAFRQGDRLIYADRMYYNATYEYGVVLAAEVFTPVPDGQGVVRLKADVLQQMNRQFFQAYGAAMTTSQMGVPKYWLQADKIDFRDTQVPRVNALTGQLEPDPRTNEAAVDHDLLATSSNNFLYLGGVPVFYWPVLATDLRKPSYYLERFAIKNDRVFGSQVLADWDVYQLLNMKDPPEGTEFVLSTDYLSKRGLGLGTTYEYERDGLLGHPGPVVGWVDAWGIHDTGVDDLGANRRNVIPDTQQSRTRILASSTELARGVAGHRHIGTHHRPQLPGTILREGVGRVDGSGDESGAQTHLGRPVAGHPGPVSLEPVRVANGLVAACRSLPARTLATARPSHLVRALPRPAIPGSTSWIHPTDPEDAAGWSFLPWEQPTMQPEGGRFSTRQEIDLPVQAGRVKLVPYALGEVGYWGAGLDDQQDLTRGYGQVGVRASFPFWKVHPTVQSMLFNLNGLAHKVHAAGRHVLGRCKSEHRRIPLVRSAR